ncbi:MAG: acyltransferase family protein [Rhizonema sp. PD38]|nr:acyltransferase family protein [Rhizonema sp. PD38]
MHTSSDITPEFKQKLSHDLYFVRGFAILWVVVGHVIGDRSAGIRQLYDQDIPILAWMYTFIYSFHMPIFFIVSGISFAVFSKSKEINHWESVLMVFWDFSLHTFLLPIIGLNFHLNY